MKVSTLQKLHTWVERHILMRSTRTGICSCFFSRHEGMWKSGGIAPLINNLGTRWSFTSRPHNPRGKCSRYLLNTGMRRHLRWSEWFGKEKYLAPARIQAKIPQLSSLQQTIYPLSYVVPAVKYFQNAFFTILHDTGLGCSFIADTSTLFWSYPHYSCNKTRQPEIVNPRVLLNNDYIQLCFKSRKAIKFGLSFT